MRRRQQRLTGTETLFPYTTLVRSAGALRVAGVIGLVVGLKPAPVRPPRSRPVQRKTMSAGMKRLLLVGVIGGCMAWLVTGWALALVAVPLACVGEIGRAHV